MRNGMFGTLEHMRWGEVRWGLVTVQDPLGTGWRAVRARYARRAGQPKLGLSCAGGRVSQSSCDMYTLVGSAALIANAVPPIESTPGFPVAAQVICSKSAMCRGLRRRGPDTVCGLCWGPLTVGCIGRVDSLAPRVALPNIAAPSPVGSAARRALFRRP